MDIVSLTDSLSLQDAPRIDNFHCATKEEKRDLASIMDQAINIRDRCGICFEKMEFTTVSIMHCKHVFCYGCIEKWAHKNGGQSAATCPICRQKSLMPFFHFYLKNDPRLQHAVMRLDRNGGTYWESLGKVECIPEDYDEISS
jgi:hypothetical protein